LGELGVRFLDLDVTEIVRLRRELILSTVMSYRPDVLLVDKKPDGLAGELEPSLRHIKCSLPQTRIHLVLRDILDSSRVTVDAWTRRGYYNILRWFYDRVLVLGDQSIFDVCEEYQFPQDLREKVHHCGYVQRQLPARSRSEIRQELGVEQEERLVFVTAGGGEDGYELFSASLAATSSLAQRLPLKTLLVTGPELGAEQTQAICRAAQTQHRLQVIKFTDDLISYMNAADIVISMAGYNTICELLTLGKRAIVVPRVRPIEEQKIRAERLAGFRAFRTILPDELTPRTLESAIEEQKIRAERLAGFRAFRTILPDEITPLILESAIEEELQLAQSTVPVSTYVDLGALPRITAILQREASSTVCGVESATIREMLAPTGSEW